MTVWCVFPSAAPVGQARVCVSALQAKGYRVAIAAEDGRTLGADWAMQQAEYPGYAASVNRLVHHILANDSDCVAVVAFGDDMAPDPFRMADEIAADLYAKHGELWCVQPTGDRWTLGTSTVPQSERVAGSPWLSRAWSLRGYQGQGPLWPEYTHCWADNDLMEVATKLGVFHQDPSITHLHNHFLRFGNSVPKHAQYAYSKFDADRLIFERRKAEGFPGSELLAG